MSDEVVEPVAPDAEAPENVAEVVAESPAVSLEDAVKVLLIYVRAHRTIGDADLTAAVADVEAALSAQG